eukprot:gene2055-4017_t
MPRDCPGSDNYDVTGGGGGGGAVDLGAFDMTLSGWGCYNYSLRSLDINLQDELLGTGTLAPEHSTGDGIHEWRTGSSSYSDSQSQSQSEQQQQQQQQQQMLLQQSVSQSRALSLYKTDPITSSYWISCGKRAQLGETFRFRKDSESGTSTAWQCKQECQQLSTDSLEEGMELQYMLTATDEKRKFLGLHSIQDTVSPVCAGNSTELNATFYSSDITAKNVLIS